jgi:antitoxin HigA-1
MIYEYHPAIGWKLCMVTVKANSAFASTTSGVFVSYGATTRLGESRSSTTRKLSMAIKREDIDKRIVDFSDLASGRQILRDAFLTPMQISVYRLAKAIKVPRSRANDIVLGRRAITTDTAMRLGRYFGMSPEFWINLQARYDLNVADRTVRKIEKEVAPRNAA